MAVVFSNNAATTLAASVTSSATSITVQDGSVFPTLNGSDYTYITLEDLSGDTEIVKLTARSGNTLTVVRAQDGTSARAFSNASKCELRLTAALLNEVAAQADTDTNTTYSVQDGELSENNFTDADHSKLDGIATSANNYTHPSAHAISFITGLQTALNAKVDDSQVLTNVPANAVFTDTNTTYSVGDGGLSQKNFTTTLKTKLDGIATGATNTAAPHYTSAIAVGAGGLTQQNFTTTLKNKLDGIAASANNYVLPFTNNSSNWNTAYGWGNHASAGYTNDQTAAEILTAIKTVDGTGSGLDADTLDGYQKADLNPAHSHYRWTNISASGTQARRFVIMRLYACPAHWDSNWQDIHLKVWSETYEATNLKYEICGDYNGGNQNTMFQLRLKDAGGSSEHTRFRLVLGTPVDAGWDHSGQNTYYVDVYAEASHYMNFTVAADFYSAGFNVNTLPTSGGATSVVYSSPTVSNITTFNEAKEHSYFANHKIWNDGNHGSASGLDADLLDGQHGSYYRAYANLTGTPTIPSLSGYATESYVGTQISNLVDSSPAALNTLNELAAALGDDASFSTTVTNSIATKLPLAGGTLTNTLYARKDNVTNYTDANIRLDSYGGSSTTVGIGFHISSSIGKYLNMNSTGVLKWNSSTIWDTSTLTTTNKANYDTAYGWGNHASGGYAPVSTTVTTTGNQSIDGIKTFTGTNVTLDNPANSWKYIRLQSAGSVKWDIATNEADDSSSLQFRAAGGGTNRVTVSQAGNLTATGTVTATGGNSTNWNTAYGWGNHASGGYLTSSSTQSKYLRSDAADTGSGTYTFSRTSTGAALDISGHPGAASYNYFLRAANDGGNKVSMFVNGSTRTADGGINTFTLRNDGGSINLGSSSHATKLLGSGDLLFNSNKVWHLGNDGSGSGLDADTVDGKHKDYLMHYKGTVSGNWDTLFSQTDGHMGVYEVHNLASGHSNHPTGVYTYGGVMSWQLDNSTFKLYSSHTGDLVFQSGWNNDEYSGWRRILTTSYYGDAWTSSNDGAGSGLDADLLDGQHASAFATAAQGTLATNALPKAGGTTTGDVVIGTTGADTELSVKYGQIIGGFGARTTGGTTDWNHSTNARSGNGYTLLLAGHTNGPSGSGYFHPFSFEYAGYSGGGNMTQFAMPYNNSNMHFRSRYSGSWSSWNKVWTSGNDGSSSGLDADLLDGQHGSYYLPTVGGTGNLELASASGTTTGYSDAGLEIREGAKGGSASYSAPRIGMHWGGVVASNISIDTAGAILIRNNPGTAYENFRANNIYANGTNTVWHVGNDGAGSTLDADLLDGQHGSYYYQASNPSGYTTNTGTLTAETVSATNTVNVTGTKYFQPAGTATSPLGGGGGASLQAYTTGTTAAYMAFHRSGAYAINWGLDTSNAMVLGGWSSSTTAARMSIGTNGLMVTAGQGNLWGASNDGAGSGLDADLLDGQQGSYYAPASGGNYWPSSGSWWASNMPGSRARGTADNGGEIVVLQDNPSNGRTSLLVDGQYYAGENGGFYSLYSGNNYNLKSGWNTDTSGHLLFSTQGHAQFNTQFGNIQIGPMNASYCHIYTNITGGFYFNKSAMYADGNTIWHAASDGAGSGLDADLLDGSQGQYYKHPTSPMSQNVSFDSFSGVSSYYNSVQFMNIYTPTAGTQATYNSPTNVGSHHHVMQFNGYSPSINNWKYMSAYSFYTGDMYTRNMYSSTWQAWRKQWDSVNDGSGSGLDADLLDGYNAEEGAVNNSIVKRDGTASIKAHGLSLMRASTATTGISWYNEAYYNWQDYMAAAGATSCGPNGNLTAPTGLAGVTSWALRSRMEGVASYGWNWETGGGAGGGATATSKMSLQAVSGNLQIAGTFTGTRLFSSDGPNTISTYVSGSYNQITSIGSVNGGARDLRFNLGQSGTIMTINANKVQVHQPLLLDGAANTAQTSSNIISTQASDSSGATRYHLSFTKANGTTTLGRITTNNFATTYTTSSDYRLKEDLVEITGATAKVLSIPTRNFRWVGSDVRTDGFLAHELAPIVPDAVVGEKDGMTTPTLYLEGEELPEGVSVGDIKVASVPDYQSVDQSKLVPLLVKTIQELEARITALENA